MRCGQAHKVPCVTAKTYAELDREDPLRETAMSASFLRASLFTSVVAFGVAAMAIGLGITLILVAMALMSVARAANAAAHGATGARRATT
jgi:hypothetical protein